CRPGSLVPASAWRPTDSLPRPTTCDEGGLRCGLFLECSRRRPYRTGSRSRLVLRGFVRVSISADLRAGLALVVDDVAAPAHGARLRLLRVHRTTSPARAANSTATI